MVEKLGEGEKYRAVSQTAIPNISCTFPSAKFPTLVIFSGSINFTQVYFRSVFFFWIENCTRERI